MSLQAGCAPRLISWKLAASLLVAVTAGCNSTVSPTAARDKQYADNAAYKKVEVAKFAGKVTIDGQPPDKDSKVFVIMNDINHLDENAKLNAPRLFMACDDAGNFSFTTNEKDDGIAVGKYVVTFLELKTPKTGGTSEGARFKAKSLGAAKKYRGPDELKNLYSDPDKNAKETDKYVLDLKPPGKADYLFDLSIAGKDVVPPGPNAVKEIRTVR